MEQYFYKNDGSFVHLLLVLCWLIPVGLQLMLELIGLIRPKFSFYTSKASYGLAYLTFPILIYLALAVVFHFEPDNLQFLTYNIMMISYVVVLIAGAYYFSRLYKRNLWLTTTNSDFILMYSNQVRKSLIVQLCAAFLAIAAKMHILNNWITDIFP